LFGFDIGGALYQIDPSTGGTTLIGGSGFPILSIAEDATFTASGQLFLNDFGGNILQVDPATGSRTLVGTTGMGLGLLALFTPVSGPPSVIPEPPTFVLLGVGMLGLFAQSGRSRKRAESTAVAFYEPPPVKPE
jgi:PEP-CTERM motif